MFHVKIVRVSQALSHRYSYFSYTNWDVSFKDIVLD